MLNRTTTVVYGNPYGTVTICIHYIFMTVLKIEIGALSASLSNMAVTIVRFSKNVALRVIYINYYYYYYDRHGRM